MRYRLQVRKSFRYAAVKLQRYLGVFLGKRRIVVPVSRFGIVIKFPRLRVQNFWDFWAGDIVGMWKEMHTSKHPEAKKLYWKSVRLGLSVVCTSAFFGGIADNWRERRYYKSCDSSFRPLLQPTYLSLLGLVNVQRLGNPSKDLSVCETLCRIIWPDAAHDGHHWDTPSNFDVSSGELKVLDYGSVETQKIINKHGWALLTKFELESRSTSAE